MSLVQRALAATFVTAMAVAPSLAQNSGAVVAKPDPAAVNASLPGNGDAPAPKWVREPIGGPKSNKFLRVADTRGQGDTFAAILALGASDKNAVILLVQGSNQKVIEDAKLQLSGLILGDGYDRVGLVIGDGPEEIAYIYSKGHKVMTLTNVVKGEDRDIAFDSEVKHIYERDVLPALSAASPQTPEH
jgi:hypothetical protein